MSGESCRASGVDGRGSGRPRSRGPGGDARASSRGSSERADERGQELTGAAEPVDPGVPQVTASQTVGPFFGFALPWQDGRYAVAEDTSGAFWVRGRVLDGAGEPVPDALVETWQADPEGRFDHPDDPRGPVRRAGFRGFARCPTDGDGRYAVWTVEPGSLPAPDGRPQAPHIDVSVFARGLLHRVVTRMYFPGEAVAADPVLAGIPDAARRATLLLARDGDGYRFDIRLQGEHETVFFDL